MVPGGDEKALRTLARDLYLGASIMNGQFGDMQFCCHEGDWRTFRERMAAAGLLDESRACMPYERVAALKAMDFLASSFNDEDLQVAWLSTGVPDGADMDDLVDIAEDDELFEGCVRTFINLTRSDSFAESGFFFG